MHLRDLVKQIWADAGLYEAKDARLRRFLTYIDETPMLCWDDYVKEFRSQYYEIFDEIIPPLLKTRDKLLRLVLIRYADLSRPQEVRLLKESIKRFKPEEDEPELLALARLGHKEITATLQKMKNPPKALQQALRPERILPPRAQNIAAARMDE